MEINEYFIILKKGKFKENDLWLKVLSPNLGFNTYFAFGGLKSRRRFCGCLDIFNLLYGKISQNKRSHYFTLQEAYLVNKFANLKDYPNKIGVIYNVTSFLEKIKITPDEYQKIFNLFVDFLSILPDVSNISYLPLLFKANLIFNLGYLPLFSKCLVCNKALGAERVFFSIKEGGFYCSSCVKFKQFTFAMSYRHVLFLQYIANSKPKDWINVKLALELRQMCYKIVSIFSEYHLAVSL
ncbi:MAG: DNA repair protein RecO [Desulfonauticus sp.]|nr:DNA repair protein RecO [Desulfonauticus sp.]